MRVFYAFKAQQFFQNPIHGGHPLFLMGIQSNQFLKQYPSRTPYRYRGNCVSNGNPGLLVLEVFHHAGKLSAFLALSDRDMHRLRHVNRTAWILTMTAALPSRWIEVPVNRALLKLIRSILISAP
jgi:hypothetical protein